MFDTLARLADGRARRIGLIAIAFFLLAGALGGSVADRLDPYGADDPATETVEAKEQLQDAGLRVPGVIVVVAGMDGALPSVIAGLVSVPVIAVPTSIGYGASFGGLAALLTMLNACSPGVAVVNIDNGYGAAVMAHRICASRPSRRHTSRTDTPARSPRGGRSPG